MTSNPSRKGPVLAIALDGADWRFVEPLLQEGEMPAVASLLAEERAFRAVLESTVPPVTFPAWATFLTGVNPGRHGVLDFARWVPGTYDVRFSGGGGLRRAPTIAERLSAAGKRVACVGLPGTWPPFELDGGFVLSGFDSPVAIGPGPDFARPRELYRRVTAEHGRWVYSDVDELGVTAGWHEKARRSLLEGLSRKGRIARALLAAEPWDLFLVHFGETDTAAHHFFAHHDPKSPRRPRTVSREAASTIREVYRAADRAIGALIEEAGEDAAVLIASDHGMEGASDRVFHPNRALARSGLLHFTAEGERGRRLASIESRVRGAALRFLPARLKEELVRRFRKAAGVAESRRRLGGIELSTSMAFSEELTYAPSVRINVRDREPLGVVAPEEVDAVTEIVCKTLWSLEDPETGEKVVESVEKREDLFDGPAISEAPEIFFTAASFEGYRCTVLSSGGLPGPWMDRLEGDAKLGGKGRGPTGMHRSDGVLVVKPPSGLEEPGKSFRRDGGAPRGNDIGRVPIGSCAATLMSFCGVNAPDDLEWPSLVAAADDSIVSGPPEHEAARGYSPREEALVRERLRALGYID